MNMNDHTLILEALGRELFGDTNALTVVPIRDAVDKIVSRIQLARLHDCDQGPPSTMEIKMNTNIVNHLKNTLRKSSSRKSVMHAMWIATDNVVTCGHRRSVTATDAVQRRFMGALSMASALARVATKTATDVETEHAFVREMIKTSPLCAQIAKSSPINWDDAESLLCLACSIVASFEDTVQRECDREINV